MDGNNILNDAGEIFVGLAKLHNMFETELLRHLESADYSPLVATLEELGEIGRDWQDIMLCWQDLQQSFIAESGMDGTMDDLTQAISRELLDLCASSIPEPGQGALSASGAGIGYPQTDTVAIPPAPQSGGDIMQGVSIGCGDVSVEGNINAMSAEDVSRAIREKELQSIRTLLNMSSDGYK